MKHRANFIVNLEFGSDWQYKTGMERFELVMKAYQQFTESRHNGNDVTFYEVKDSSKSAKEFAKRIYTKRPL